jgi:hypothetical protein
VAEGGFARIAESWAALMTADWPLLRPTMA